MERRYLYALIIGAFALFNCRSEAPSPAVESPAEPPAAHSAPRLTNITVQFAGLICHVLDSGNASVPPRAVALRGGPAKMDRHNLTIILPPVDDASRPLLEQLGTVSEKDGRLWLSGVEGLSLRFEGISPPLTAPKEWKDLVPSLQEASGHPNRFPREKLHRDLRRLDPPSPSGPFTLFFEYGGGLLSAEPFEQEGVFDRPGAKPRKFSQSTTLKTSINGSPVLVATRSSGTSSDDASKNVTPAKSGTDSVSISFRDEGDISIQVLNVAEDTKHAHFHLFKDVSDGTVPIPRVRPVGEMRLSPFGTVVGCADSTYP